MADSDRNPYLIDEFLDLKLKEPNPRSVTCTNMRRNEKFGGIGLARTESHRPLDLSAWPQHSRHGQIIRPPEYHFLSGAGTPMEGPSKSLLDDKLLIITENVVQSSPCCVRFSIAPGDNSGSDDYQQG